MDSGDGAPWRASAPSPVDGIPPEVLAERFGREHETWEVALAALEHEVSGTAGKGLRYGAGNTGRSTGDTRPACPQPVDKICG